ncbi:uncharacterized protein LOC126905712 [Daktulosphaira vitifoliae]|uniref:uncharacterized protein LOC126905712 n=1 Tax=Daktulosphaira vitifoliae TaxID=58002 RepID=UPI0021AA11A1|nr:uncharacterized protein LOC126905712 [Daktulosphaira vitifoliae]
MKILPNGEYDKNILQQALDDEYNDNDIKPKVTYVLSNLYGLLQIHIYSYFCIICLDMFDDETGSSEFLLTEYTKLTQMIKVFDPLSQCMLKGLDYFEFNNRKDNFINYNIKYYNEMNKFIHIKNYVELKSSDDLLSVLKNLYDVNDQFFLAKIRLFQHNNIPIYYPFIDEYIDQLENLIYEDKDDLYLDLKEKVEEGVQMFCKDFGFV